MCIRDSLDEDDRWILRPGIEKQLAKLKSMGYSMDLWTTLGIHHVRELFEIFPQLNQYFDYKITGECTSSLMVLSLIHI